MNILTIYTCKSNAHSLLSYKTKYYEIGTEKFFAYSAFRIFKTRIIFDVNAEWKEFYYHLLVHYQRQFVFASLEVKRKKCFLGNKNHECLRMPNHNLNFENWHSVYIAVNVDDAYDNFFDVFMEHYHTSCPIVKVLRKNEKNNKPCFTMHV